MAAAGGSWKGGSFTLSSGSRSTVSDLKERFNNLYRSIQKRSYLDRPSPSLKGDILIASDGKAYEVIGASNQYINTRQLFVVRAAGRQPAGYTPARGRQRHFDFGGRGDFSFVGQRFRHVTRSEAASLASLSRTITRSGPRR